MAPMPNSVFSRARHGSISAAGESKESTMFNRPMTAATRTSAQPVPGLDYFTDAPIQPAPVADMPAPAQDALHAALDQMFGYYA
jgi:hypothetical protein